MKKYTKASTLLNAHIYAYVRVFKHAYVLMSIVGFCCTSVIAGTAFGQPLLLIP